MKKVYICANLFELSLIKQQLENAKVSVLVKNEFTSGAMGEIPPHETMPEIWVVKDTDYAQAKTICAQWEQQENKETWWCKNCGEINEGSFDFCWQCQTAKV